MSVTPVAAPENAAEFASANVAERTMEPIEMPQPKLNSAITIRCTKEELQRWKTKAKAERKSRSAFIRDRANR